MHFGIREHGMGSAMNGMALFGSVIPYGGRSRPFRIIAAGDTACGVIACAGVVRFYARLDRAWRGRPTHQSVEHLAAMRAIPNLAVIRPCDAHETREAWRAALKRENGPTAFALSRQKVDVIDRKKYADARGLHKGAYVLAEAATKTGKPANRG